MKESVCATVHHGGSDVKKTSLHVNRTIHQVRFAQLTSYQRPRDYLHSKMGRCFSCCIDESLLKDNVKEQNERLMNERRIRERLLITAKDSGDSVSRTEIIHSDLTNLEHA